MIVVDSSVAVHTDIWRRDGCGLTVPGVAMTEETADLIESGVYMMGKEDGLLGLIALLAAYADAEFDEPPADEEADDDDDQGNIELVAVKGNRWRRRVAALFIGEAF